MNSDEHFYFVVSIFHFTFGKKTNYISECSHSEIDFKREQGMDLRNDKTKYITEIQLKSTNLTPCRGAGREHFTFCI